MRSTLAKTPTFEPGSATRLPLCLTIGDPTGIGPEIAVKFLSDTFSGESLIVIGDIANLEKTAGWLKRELPKHAIQYIDVGGENKLPGRIAYEAIAEAVRLMAEGRACALVTGPISKENLFAAGFEYPGHTEILEALANQHFSVAAPYQSDMLFVYNNFRMLLLTRHVALNAVSHALTQQGTRQSLESLVDFLKTQAGITKPRIAVMGVNPHAGEIGGTEEQIVLEPVIAAINASGKAECVGPLATDALFRNFDVNRLSYDAYVAAYHDQGLIPFKMVAGYEAVNVTIGLPFVRTSVSHGTAPDIAGKGVADPQSLAAAFELAGRLVSA